MGYISVAASHKARNVGFELIQETKLDVLTQVSQFIGIIPIRYTFLMAFLVAHTTANAVGDKFESATINQRLKDFEFDFSERLCCLVAVGPKILIPYQVHSLKFQPR